MGCPAAPGRMPGTEDGGPAGPKGEAEIWLTRQPGCDGDQDSCSLALDRTKVAVETAEPAGARRALTAASKLSYK